MPPSGTPGTATTNRHHVGREERLLLGSSFGAAANAYADVFDNRVDWVAELERIAGSAAIGPRDTFGSWRAGTAEANLPDIGSSVRFDSPERAEFPHGQRRTADSLVATFATKAGMLVMPEQERQATLGRIRAFLASRPRPLTANSRCRC